jgi:hypothetical protein
VLPCFRNSENGTGDALDLLNQLIGLLCLHLGTTYDLNGCLPDREDIELGLAGLDTYLSPLLGDLHDHVDGPILAQDPGLELIVGQLIGLRSCLQQALPEIMGLDHPIDMPAAMADHLTAKIFEGRELLPILRVAVDFSQFDEPRYQRFMAALVQIEEMVSALLKSARGATPERKKSAGEKSAGKTAKPKMLQMGSIAGIGPIMVEMPPEKTDTKEG